MLTPRDQSLIKTVARAARKRVDQIKSALSAEIRTLTSQLAELRAAVADRPERGEKGEKGDPGEPGRSVHAEDVLPELKAQVERLVEAFPAPKDGQDGKSVTVDDVYPLLEAKFEGWARDYERHAGGIISRALDRIPEPQSGKDGRDGADGKDADPELVAAKVIERLDLKGTRTDMKRLAAEIIDSRMAEIPAPKDGAPGKDGESGRDGQDGATGKDGAPGKDGESGRDGQDGATGKDGESVTPEQVDAAIAKHLDTMIDKWALDFERRAQDMLQKAVDRLPPAKDGRDGFSLEHFDFQTPDGGRTLILTFDDGKTRQERTIVTHAPQYREIWKQETQYEIGDMVTWDGSTWSALTPSKGEKPGSFGKAWRLMVKKGRDGSSK